MICQWIIKQMIKLHLKHNIISVHLISHKRDKKYHIIANAKSGSTSSFISVMIKSFPPLPDITLLNKVFGSTLISIFCFSHTVHSWWTTERWLNFLDDTVVWWVWLASGCRSYDAWGEVIKTGSADQNQHRTVKQLQYSGSFQHDISSVGRAPLQPAKAEGTESSPGWNHMIGNVVNKICPAS